jgi:hypothetical protein
MKFDIVNIAILLLIVAASAAFGWVAGAEFGLAGLLISTPIALILGWLAGTIIAERSF